MHNREVDGNSQLTDGEMRFLDGWMTLKSTYPAKGKRLRDNCMNRTVFTQNAAND
jgi:hypothetical protein